MNLATTPVVAAQVLFGVNQRLRIEDVDSPLIQIRPVKTCLVAVVTGDRGLCGGYNNFVIKKVRPPHFSWRTRNHTAELGSLLASICVAAHACGDGQAHF